MSDPDIVEHTIAFVKEALKGAEGGHDWFHIKRVHANAQLIAKTEKVDKLVVSLGALLHDIADAKFNDGDETIGPRMAREFLISQQLDEAIVDQVVNIIENISFKSNLRSDGEDGKKTRFSSKELDVIQDADRLDAIGAIGIARAFNYGGFKNRELYNPDTELNLGMTKEQYKKSKAPTINHFYEKLLLLKDLMNTETGKILAAERHQFMLVYLEQFYKEWNGIAS